MRSRSVLLTLVVFICIVSLCGGALAETLVFPLTAPIGEASGAPALSDDFGSIVMIDSATGELLYSRDETAEISPSGIAVSLMTAYIAACELPMDESVSVGKAEREFPNGGRSIGLDSDSTMTVRDLIAATVLYGAQDAAATLAYRIDGDVDAFVDRMNAKALELGMSATKYENPLGAYDSSQKTTCADTMILMHSVMQNEELKAIFAAPTYTFASSNSGIDETVESRIIMMLPDEAAYDARVRGMGLGVTSSGGSNILIGAENEGRSVLIMMHADSARAEYPADAKLLMDYGFSEFSMLDGEAVAAQLAAEFELTVGGEIVTGFTVKDYSENRSALVTRLAAEGALSGGARLNVTEQFAISETSVEGDDAAYASLYVGETELATLTLALSAENAALFAAESEPAPTATPDPDELVERDFTLYTASDWQPAGGDSFMANYGWIAYIVGAAFIAVVVLLISYLAQRRR